MSKNVWKERGEKYHFFETTPVYEFLSGFIEKECESVFEGAVGSGSFPAILRKNGWKGKYLGSDYSEKFLESALINNPYEDFVFQDLKDTIKQEDNSFDCCVVINGIDYIYPYQPVIQELKRVAKKYIIIDLWQDFLPEKRIHFNEEYKWGVNTYDYKEWYQMIEDLDLKIIVDADIKYYNKYIGRILPSNLFIFGV